MFIESLGFNGQGMNQKAAYAENIACLYRGQHGVLQLSNADAAALPGSVDSKTAKHGDRHGIRHISGQRGRRIVQCQRTGGKAVIADNSLSFGNDIGARCAADLVWVGPPPESGIQAVDTAGKVVKLMFGRKQNRRGQHYFCQGLSEDISRSKPSPLGGRSRISRK